MDRNKRLSSIARKGCGKRFLEAMYNSLESTEQMINTAKFKTTSGIRQGRSTSCSSFTLYIQQFLQPAVKHVQEIHFLKASTDALGIKTHPTKSLHIYINKSQADTLPFILDDITISNTDRSTTMDNFEDVHNI